MNCQEANRLLDAGELPSAQRETVQRHMAHCEACRVAWNNWHEIVEWPVPEMPAALRQRIVSAMPAHAMARRSRRPFLVVGLFAMGAAAAAALVVQQVARNREVARQDVAPAAVHATPATRTMNASTLPSEPMREPAATAAAPAYSIAPTSRQVAATEVSREFPTEQDLPPALSDVAHQKPLDAPSVPAAGERIAAASAPAESYPPPAPTDATLSKPAEEAYKDWPDIEQLVLEAANNRFTALNTLAAWNATAMACPGFDSTMSTSRLANLCPELHDLVLSPEVPAFWATCERRIRNYNRLSVRFSRAKPREFTVRTQVARALDGAYVLLGDYCNASTYSQRFPKVIYVFRRAHYLQGNSNAGPLPGDGVLAFPSMAPSY